jgi:hypothetical protein
MTIWRRCPSPQVKTFRCAQRYLAQKRRLDISNYSVGSAVMVLWPGVMLFLSLAYGLRNISPELSTFTLIGGGVITGIPAIFIIQGLFREVRSPYASTANAEKSASRATMANTGSSHGKP